MRGRQVLWRPSHLWRPPEDDLPGDISQKAPLGAIRRGFVILTRFRSGGFIRSGSGSDGRPSPRRSHTDQATCCNKGHVDGPRLAQHRK